MRFLREKYNMMHNAMEIKIVVQIKGKEKNKGNWSIGIMVEELFKGKDEVIRGVKLRTPKSSMDRPI